MTIGPAEQFVESGPNRPDELRHIIHLQPIDDFAPGSAPPFKALREFTEAFFGMEVRVLPPIVLAGSDICDRINPYTAKLQLLTTDILGLLKERLPQDSFCLLGITLHDLYPDPSWNFVFGQASTSQRVGIYSFARYDPLFYGIERLDRDSLMLRRSCKVLAHETSHMFGIWHCIYFRCLMNGSNHLEESDARPLHLCPVDLRKLYDSVGFELEERYSRLRAFCREVGFDDEGRWMDAQLHRR